jgi:hypothetical protein
MEEKTPAVRKGDEKAEELLYHYTDLAAFKSIIENG